MFAQYGQAIGTQGGGGPLYGGRGCTKLQRGADASLAKHAPVFYLFVLVQLVQVQYRCKAAVVLLAQRYPIALRLAGKQLCHSRFNL